MSNQDPTLSGLISSDTFGENLVNATPQLIDTDVTFNDPNNNFSGGHVKVTGLLAEDRVAIRNEGTTAGLIGVSGSNVTYGGTTIGSFTGGIGNAFDVTLNGSADSAAVDALIQNLTYGDVSDTPTAARTLTINVFDAAGADIEGAPTITQLTGVNNLFSTFTTTQSYILPTGLDFDNDGDTDLAVGTDDGTLLAFRNNGNGSFTQLIGAGVNPFFGVDVGGFSSPAAGDVDNDGYLDLVVGADTHVLVYLHNNHDGSFTKLTAGANPFTGLNFSTISQPSAGDFDNDGDTDFIVTEATSTIHSFRNNGNGTFTELIGAGVNPFAAFAGQSVGSTFVDFDFDGDADVLMGRSNGTLVYGQNNGNGTFTQLTGALNPFNGIDTGSYSSPVFVDVDGDGDLDMISGSSTRVLTTWRNNATHGKAVIINVTAEAENSAPTVNHNAGLTLNEGATGTLSATQLDFNDAEQADTAITYTVTSVATNGTLKLSGSTLGLSGTFTQDDINNSRVTYVHNGSETTSGSFGFSVSDGVAAPVTGQTFAFSVTPQNDAPTLGTNAGLTLDEGASAIITAAQLDFNDVEQADTAITYTVTSATNGTLKLSGSAIGLNGTFTQDDLDNNRVTFVHDGSETTTASFGFSVSDGAGGSVTGQTFAFTVTPQNDAPTMGANTGLTLDEGATATITASQLDFDDPDQADTAITYTVTSGATNGTVQLSGSTLGVSDSFTQDDLDNNRITYVHDGGETTSDSFGFSVSDGQGGSVTGQTFAFTITPQNDAPTLAANTGLTLDEGATGTITAALLDFNDAEQADTAITYTVTSAATNGALMNNGVALAVNDSFTQDDINNGLVTYAHDGGETTNASLGFSVSDGVGGSVTGQSFDFTVTPQNDAPTLGANAGLTLDEGATATVTAAQLDFSDAEQADTAITYTVTSAAINGVLQLGGTTLGVNDSFTQDDLDNNRVTFVHDGGETTSDSFGFSVSDGAGGSVSGQSFAFTVTPQNDAPTVGANTGLRLDEGATGTITALLLDFDDPEQVDMAITYTVTSGATNGAIQLSGTTLGVNDSFTQDDLVNNRVTFVHDGGETTSDSFGFSVSDGAGGSVTGQTFAFTVTPQNDAPDVGAGSTLSYTENDAATAIAPSATVSDPDSPDFDTGTLTVTFTANGALEDRLSILDVGAGAGEIGVSASAVSYEGTQIGTFAGGTDGSTPLIVTFNASATAAAVQALAQAIAYSDVSEDPSSAARTVEFVVTDGDGGTSTTANATIDVISANDAAVLSADTRNLTETNDATDISSLGTLTIGDVDSAATFVAQTDTAGSYGSFSVDVAGAWTYTASSAHDEFVGGTTYSDSFSVAAADGTTTSVTVDILGANDAAVLSADVRSLTETNDATDIGSSGTLTISDVDSAATFVAQTGTAGSYGSFSIDAAGAWTYAASSAHDEFVGSTTYSDGFSVAAADGTTTSVTIDILGANDAAVVDLNTGTGGIDDTNVYAEGGDGSGIGAAIQVSDLDGDQIVGAKITLDAPQAGDQLFATLPLPPGITVDALNSTDSLLVLTGTASASDYAAALGQLGFRNTSDDPVAGDRSITVTVNDATIDSAPATMTMTVFASDDAPVAVADTDSTDENATVNIAVMSNDTDVDGGPMAVAYVEGQTITTGNSVTLTSGATVKLESNGTLTYDPNGKFNYLVAAGTTNAADTSTVDSFSYKLDGDSVTTVDVTVNGVTSTGDELRGDAGNDTIAGTSGSDFFNLSQGGSDTATGGAGSDGFYFSGGLDSTDNIDGGTNAGTDDQVGLQGNFTYTFGANNLLNIETLAIISGHDTRFGNTSGSDYSYDLTTVNANVAAGTMLTVNANNLAAGENLTFNGAAETDGNFLFYAGQGIDNLTGGQLDDGFFFGEGGRFAPTDHVDGQGGADDQLGIRGDYSVLTTFSATSMVNVETLALLSATDSRFAAPGTAYDYNLKLDDANVASGSMLTVSGNNLRADESMAVDGSAETNGWFRFYAGAGDDTLIGGAGDDRFTGGLGQDVMTGNGGADTFYFRTTAESAVGASADQITDFTVGDHIDLSAIDAIVGGGNDAFTFLGSGAFTNHAGEARVVQTGGVSWTLQVDTDGDGTPDMAIAFTTADAHPVNSADFIL